MSSELEKTVKRKLIAIANSRTCPICKRTFEVGINAKVYCTAKCRKRRNSFSRNKARCVRYQTLKSLGATTDEAVKYSGRRLEVFDAFKEELTKRVV